MIFNVTYHEHTLGAYDRAPNLLKTCDIAISTIQKANLQFESFAFTGISGALVVPILAVMMDKYITVVRKNGDNTHSTNMVEGAIGCNYIIVDDFICSCKTVRTIARTLKDTHENFNCVGIYLHRDFDLIVGSRLENFIY